MKTFDGYKKQALTDVYALLAGGGHKPLSEFSMAHTHPYLPLNGGTITGNIILKGDTSADMTYAGNVHPYIRFDNSYSSQNISLIFTDYDDYRSPAGIKLVGNQGSEWFEAANIYATTFYGTLSGNASTATNADKVDGYHASSLWRSDGATWNPGANVSLNASANNQEWSFDIRRNGYTGCYWHVWDSTLNTLLKVNADNGKVYAPYNFVGNLEGNASTATTLTTNAGNSINPVYFSGGKPIACTMSTGRGNGILRSFSRGTYTSANQYFGNGTIVAIDPIGTGCISANDTILSLGDLANRNTQLLVAYDRDGVYYRRITDNLSYGSWKRLAFTTDNVASATKLQTPRSIWGQSFDGTANVNGSLSGVGHIQFSANNTYNIGSNSVASKYIYTYWLGAKSGQKLELGANNSNFGQGLCIDTNLNVGIGTNTPAYKLDVIGNIRATGNSYATHFYESSDKTLKKNIKSILSSTNIPKIREFDWKDTGEHSYGFIAQELEEQGYGCLVNEADGKKTVNYTATLALTVAKLQNLINIQNKKISNLTKELKALKYGRKKNS